jgi:hypothetical protein
MYQHIGGNGRSPRERGGDHVDHRPRAKDPGHLRRVFIEDGVMTWPNGYDWDPIALHDEMKAEGLLRQADAAAE